jgi:hypothetical protein
MEPALADLFRRLKLAAAEQRLDALEQLKRSAVDEAGTQAKAETQASPPQRFDVSDRPRRP